MFVEFKGQDGRRVWVDPFRICSIAETTEGSEIDIQGGTVVAVVQAPGEVMDSLREVAKRSTDGSLHWVIRS